MRLSPLLACAVLAALPSCAFAQRADDNAVRSADDAFGNSVGNENIGLYNPFEVRGFSAVDAGNVRLDGLYFDRQTDPSRLLVPSSTMRVGISAQGYLLPAPTGIVDYELRRAGEKQRISPVMGWGPFDSRFMDVEFETPIVSERLSLGGGVSVFNDEYENGVTEEGYAFALAPRWRPNESTEVIPFYSRVDTKDMEAEPLIFTAGPYLPPEIERGRFHGQDWADNDGLGENYGVVSTIELPQNWTVRAGAFRSQFVSEQGYVDLYLDTTPDGLANHVIIADPEQKFSSTSGELRISRRFDEGVRRHALHYSMRGRDQQRRYGGSDIHDLGVARIGTRTPAAEPQSEFGPQTRDEVQQWTHAIAYQGRWADLAELSLGLQKTSYEKRVTPPGESPQLGEDDPWLYNAGVALHASERLAWYASYSRGLEEGGVAPENAANKDAAPPAIRTKQWDAGFRYAFTEQLKVVAGVFDIEKPYYSLDSANIYRSLGEQRHQGVEFSIAGQALEGFNIVVGAMFMNPEVTGEEVDSGAIGEVPVGQINRLIIAGADYRIPRLPGLSVDATLTHVGDRMVTTDNQLEIPSRSVLDMGARWRFKIGRSPATVRFFVGNVFDRFGWRTNTSSVFVTNAPRRFSISIAADFVGE